MTPAFNPENSTYLGSYTDLEYSGFVTSGNIYETVFCMGAGSCKLMTIYAADIVTQDNLLFKMSGEFGIIGFGPLSPIWYTLTDPVTNQATYSIALARVTTGKPSPMMLGDLTSTSNLTLGGFGDNTYYQNMPAANITAVAANNASYSLSNFTFGIVYTNGTQDTSEYFEKLTNATSYLAGFDTASQGLSLPTAMRN